MYSAAPASGPVIAGLDFLLKYNNCCQLLGEGLFFNPGEDNGKILLTHPFKFTGEKFFLVIFFL